MGQFWTRSFRQDLAFAAWAFCFAFATLTSQARAQEALVLSGGSSRGLAHAGAIVGLERKGYDPDLIVGTSMGAIVGGLYASGYEPDSIWTLIERENWRRIFTPAPAFMGPDRRLRHQVVQLQVARSGEVQVRSFIPEWRINRRLAHVFYAASARAEGDFDRLPRRFRALAADLDTGEPVPLARGDLARAVRASIAAPGFFTPVRWQTRLLTDGGTADYLPVAEARGLGARHVIAVDVLRPPRRAHSLDAFQVANRSIDLLLMQSRSGDADVLILPPIDPSLLPLVYPDDPGPLLRAGLRAVEEQVRSPIVSNASSAFRASADRPTSASADIELEVQEEDAALGRLVERAFHGHVRDPHDSQAVLRSLDRLYATGLFEGVWPSLERSTPGEPIKLVVRTEAVPRLGAAGSVGYENDRGARIWGSLRHRQSLLGQPAVAGVEGFLDRFERMGTASARLPATNWLGASWVAGASVQDRELRVVEDSRTEADVLRAGGWLGIESRRLDPEVFASLALRGEWIDSEIGPTGSSFGPLLRIGAAPDLVELLGVPPSLEAEFRFGEVAYWRADARGSIGRRIGPLDVALMGDVASADEEAPLDAFPALGDEHLIPALHWGEERGRTRLVTGLDLGHPIPRKGTLRLRLRGGMASDRIEPPSDDAWIGGAGLASIWWTPFGRVEGGAEANTRGDRRLVVSVGADL